MTAGLLAGESALPDLESARSAESPQHRLCAPGSGKDVPSTCAMPAGLRIGMIMVEFQRLARFGAGSMGVKLGLQWTSQRNLLIGPSNSQIFHPRLGLNFVCCLLCARGRQLSVELAHTAQ